MSAIHGKSLMTGGRTVTSPDLIHRELSDSDGIFSRWRNGKFEDKQTGIMTEGRIKY
jgi:hypothetical protein